MGGTKKSPRRLSPTVEDPPPSDRRVRVADWMAVLKVCDENMGSWVKVGKFDAAVGTHIRNGKYSYIDPTLYAVKQAKIQGSKSKSPVWIFLMRRP
jgi:hypothetical protein